MENNAASNANPNITPALETLGQILDIQRESNENDIGNSLTIV